MKLKIDQPVLDFDGTPIERSPASKDADGKDVKAIILTHRMVIENSLHLQEDGKPMTAEMKQTAFQVGVRINYKKLAEYDLTIDQVKFLKERIGKFYGTVPYGRFLELIGDEAVKSDEPEEEPKKKK